MRVALCALLVILTGQAQATPDTTNWTPSTENVDGTPAQPISSFALYWGESSGSYTQLLTPIDPATTTYTFDPGCGPIYVALTQTDITGKTSALSNEIIKNEFDPPCLPGQMTGPVLNPILASASFTPGPIVQAKLEIIQELNLTADSSGVLPNVRPGSSLVYLYGGTGVGDESAPTISDDVTNEQWTDLWNSSDLSGWVYSYVAYYLNHPGGDVTVTGTFAVGNGAGRYLEIAGAVLEPIPDLSELNADGLGISTFGTAQDPLVPFASGIDSGQPSIVGVVSTPSNGNWAATPVSNEPDWVEYGTGQYQRRGIRVSNIGFAGVTGSLNVLTARNAGSAFFGFRAVPENRLPLAYSPRLRSDPVRFKQYLQALVARTKLDAAGPITGTVAVTLEGVTSNASGLLSFSGSINETLENVGISSSGALTFIGSLSEVLEDIAITSTGALSFIGSLSEVLEDIAIAASGALTFTGSLSEVLEDINSAASGFVANNIGSVNVTLENLGISASGTLTFSGTVSETLEDINIAATGQQTFTGSLNEVLEAINSAASGVVANNIGSLSVTLEDVDSNASGLLTFAGTLSEVLENIAVAASGTNTSPAITGTLTITLENINVFAAGNVGALVEILLPGLASQTVDKGIDSQSIERGIVTG